MNALTDEEIQKYRLKLEQDRSKLKDQEEFATKERSIIAICTILGLPTQNLIEISNHTCNTISKMHSYLDSIDKRITELERINFLDKNN